MSVTILMLSIDRVTVMNFEWDLGTGHLQEHANAFEIHKNIFWQRTAVVAMEVVIPSLPPVCSGSWG